MTENKTIPPMGRRLPLGIQTFEEIRKKGYTYVDKTGFIYQMTHDFKYAFLSRPRRFGKSLLVSTLKSYVEGRRDLFEGLAISHLEQEWTKFPVVHISLAAAKGSLKDICDRIDYQLKQAETTLGIARQSEGFGNRLSDLVVKSAEKYGQQAVVLIDEYDAPLLSVFHEPELLKEVRQTLRTFYAPLKDLDPWLRFVFITGISKFSQTFLFSEIDCKQITLDKRYSAVCGFTEEELHNQWHWAVAKLAQHMCMSTDDTYALLKQQYDGYRFAKDLTTVYNPFSLLNCFQNGELDAKWLERDSPALFCYMLQRFHTDISRMDGIKAWDIEFDRPTEDVTSIMQLFYQFGFLTIKDYDRKLGTFSIGCPNQEVKTSMISLFSPHAQGRPDTRTISE